METVNSEQKVFECISPYTARFGNVLYAYEKLCSVDFLGKQIRIVPSAGAVLSSISFVLHLNAAGSLWKIAFDSDAFLLFHPSLKEEVKENNEIRQNYAELFPMPLKQALLESLFAPFVQEFSKKIGTEIAVIDVSYEDKTCSLQDGVLFKLQFSEPGGEGVPDFAVCCLEVPQERQSLVLLEALQKILPDTDSMAQEYGEIPCTVFFSAGRTELTAEQMQNLSCGDYILLDEWFGRNASLRAYPLCRSRETADMLLFSEHSYIHCELKDGLAHVAAWVSSCIEKEQVMDSEKNESLQDNSAGQTVQADQENSVQADISQIALNMHFCLEDRVLTLQELQSVKPGYVFALGQDFLSPVKLVVNGKIVGSGKIVDINGTVGVQVVSLNK